MLNTSCLLYFSEQKGPDAKHRLWYRGFYCENVKSWGFSGEAGPEQAAACRVGEPVFLKAEEIEVSKKHKHGRKSDVALNSWKVGQSNENHVDDWMIWWWTTEGTGFDPQVSYLLQLRLNELLLRGRRRNMWGRSPGQKTRSSQTQDTVLTTWMHGR